MPLEFTVVSQGISDDSLGTVDPQIFNSVMQQLHENIQMNSQP